MVGARARGRVRERALRGVEAGRKVAAQKDKNVTNEDREDEETDVHEDDGDEADGEESPRKRRRVGGEGESVAVVGPSRKPAPASAGVTGSSVTLPAKRPIGEVTSDARPRPLRVAPKPPLNRARPLTSKRERPARLAAQPSTSRPTKPTRPPVSRLPRANNSKSLASHTFPSGSRNITKN